MCGIAGIVAPAGRFADPLVLQVMTDRLGHRGPDGEGFVGARSSNDRLAYARVACARQWTATGEYRIGLGHRRLSIIDLSEHGAQPMAPAGDPATWIVFNGEIYNHRELRDRLAGAGYRFETRTDTEVLLQAYRYWGQECLDHLEGMYAFAIWDARAGKLFCARDRLGMKPFYYHHGSGGLLFASEIKALFAHPAVAAHADDEAVVGFLIHTNCDYGERTTFRDIRALPAAHSLTYDLASERLELRRYWTLEPHPQEARSDQAHIDGLRELLLDSARKHLISDVRAGSCLSGGLDSSAVVALIAEVRRADPEAATAVGERLHTFTSCWDYPKIDEREYALAMANAVDADPHLVFPTASDFWANFAGMAWLQDMPFTSFSCYAHWRVVQAAKEAGVKVLLDGQGGDEVFGGYAKFIYANFASLLRRGRFVTLAHEAGSTMRQGDLYVLDLRRGYRYLPGPLRRLFRVDSLLRTVLRADWGESVAAESTPATRWWRNAGSSGRDEDTLIQRVQVDDIITDTLPQLLRFQDRCSMAFSLEGRMPLLDHRLVEYGLSLPDHLKIQDGRSKYAVRQAMQGLMPDRVRQRTTKLGFAAPDREWLLGELRPQITELIGEPLRAEAYIDVPALRRWYATATPENVNTESCLGLFRILALEMWMRAFDV